MRLLFLLDLLPHGSVFDRCCRCGGVIFFDLDCLVDEFGDGESFVFKSDSLCLKIYRSLLEQTEFRIWDDSYQDIIKKKNINSKLLMSKQDIQCKKGIMIFRKRQNTIEPSLVIRSRRLNGKSQFHIGFFGEYNLSKIMVKHKDIKPIQDIFEAVNFEKIFVIIIFADKFWTDGVIINDMAID